VKRVPISGEELEENGKQKIREIGLKCKKDDKNQ